MIPTSDLRPFQKEYVENHAFDVARYLMWEPRMGKTRGEVRAMERRIKERGARRLLVVGPQKPLELTWTPELALRGLLHVPLHQGTLHERVVQLRNPPYTEAVLTVNFDVLETPLCPLCYAAWTPARNGGPDHGQRHHPGKKVPQYRPKISDLLLAWGPQDIIVDEAHLVASAGAQRTFALRRMGRNALCRRMLSGTPDPQGNISLYAQYAFLDPTIFGTSKKKFLDEYAIINPFTHGIEGYKNPDKLLAKAFTIADRVRAKDWFGEIPEYETIRTIPWPKVAWEAYRTLKREHVLTAEDDGIVLDGTHRLTRLLRFLQLGSGFLKDESTGEVHWLHDAKNCAVLDDLREPLEDGQHVVVSYVSTEQGKTLTWEINHKYGAGTAERVSGSTNNPNDLLRLFDVNSTDNRAPRVLVVQERVGGVGINLARAQHLFFAGWTMDQASHDQMRKRIWDSERPTRPSFYTYYEMEHSADVFARELVRDKSKRSIMAKYDLAAAIDGYYKELSAA
jgi:hypothetical protein